MNTNYYTVDDVMKMVGVSQSKAYQIIRSLNTELKEKGFIIVAGKVSKKYFKERSYQ